MIHEIVYELGIETISVEMMLRLMDRHRRGQGSSPIQVFL